MRVPHFPACHLKPGLTFQPIRLHIANCPCDVNRLFSQCIVIISNHLTSFKGCQRNKQCICPIRPLCGDAMQYAPLLNLV